MAYYNSPHLSGISITTEPAIVTSFGPDAVVSNCNIEICHGQRSLLLSKSRFIDCLFHAKKPLKNFQDWCNANIVGCKFVGTFSGNDFGNWPEVFGDFGSIIDCDFSCSILKGCRFFGCDPESIRLPVWPTIAIRNPAEAFGSIQIDNLSGSLKRWIYVSTFVAPSLQVDYAPDVCKRYGVSEDELKNFIRPYM